MMGDRTLPVFDPADPQWGRMPPVTVTGPATQGGANRITLPTSAGRLTVTAHPWGARLRIGPEPVRDYGMVLAPPPTVAGALTAGEDRTRIESAGGTLTIDHQPLAFSLTDETARAVRSATDGHFARRYRLPPLCRTASGWFIALDLHSEEAIYGLGEKWAGLNRRGQIVRSFNHDALGVNAERSYKNCPFAWSSDGWGVFVHTPCPVTHGIGHGPWSQRAYGLLVEDDHLDLFLVLGESPAAIIATYTGLTGRSPIPPLWSLGVILSRAYYRTADDILAVAHEVRARGMPCDTITFDGRAWLDTNTRFAFEWDPARYPDPPAVLAELKAMHFKICVWEYPLVSVNSPLFAEMAGKGWLLRDAATGETAVAPFDPEPFGDVLTQLPPSGIVDFTHPDAYADWRDRHKGLFDIGVDMIKPDFGEQVTDAMVAHNGATGHELHNVYALLYNRCVHEAAERYCPSGAFLFSRAGWTGSQRYPSQWGGDPQADWEGLAASLRGGLSWGMTGAPFYATDIGGYYGDTRDEALYVRWAQAAVFSAHMRLHGIGAREPWSYGPEAERAVTAALTLRMRLLPYLWRAIEQASRTGMPVQRAMALAFPADRIARGFDNQFMFGDDMLVAPVVRPDGRVQVYLPEGTWVGLLTGARDAGGRVLDLTLGLGEIAAFVRAGARIPFGPVVAHTGELGDRPVTVEERLFA